MHPRFNRYWLLVIILVSLVLATYIAYRPVMFNFFTSDDFNFVSWLNDNKQHPSFLFHGVDEGTPYYRPFLNIILYLEYLVVGTNSCTFRVINLSYKMLTVIVLGFLSQELIIQQNNQSNWEARVNWPLFSAGLFLLYPLHTEPINWFVSTTEVLSTLVFLASFLFYLLWRRLKQPFFFFLSCLFAACSFFTKEITVTLPVVILTYEVIAEAVQLNHQGSRLHKNWSNIITAVLATTPYWVLLLGYLFVRKIVTGHFLGAGTFFFPDYLTMLKCWAQSIKVIIVPISTAVFHNYFFYFIWMILIGGLASATIYAAARSRHSALLVVFLAVWFFICLVPMLGCLAISTNLLNARYGYLASVPLCLLLTYGFAILPAPKISRYVRYSVVAVILILFCFILHTNNSAWAEAGKLTDSLLKEFTRIHNDPNNTEKRLYFLNIPENYKGVAINGLNCMESMNHIPFAQKNYINATWLLHADQALPIGLLKYDIAWGNVFAYFYYFDIQSNHFQLIDFTKHVESNTSKYVATQIGVSNRAQGVQVVDSLGAAHPISRNAEPTYLLYPSKLECWDADAVVLKVKIENTGKIKSNQKVRLIYTNNILKIPDNAEQVTTALDSTRSEQYLVFMLRGRPIWTLGGECRTIAVSFPSDCNAKISEAYAVEVTGQMPKIKVLYPGFDKNTGRFELNKEYPQVTICYETDGVRYCPGVVLEAIGPHEDFKELNSPNSKQVSLISVRNMMPCGRITVTRARFKKTGLYKLRLRPIDKSGNQTGFCSDYFLLHVTND